MDSVNDTDGIYEEAKHIFKKAAMNLREWNSNCSEFLECLPNGEGSITSGITKVLGLFWDPVGDTLSVPLLGFLSPITIHGKLILQKLWVANQSWDEPISPDLMSEWSQVLQLLIEIPDLNIPRFVNNVKSGMQLLIFCDASTKAYATVTYLRIRDASFPTNFLIS